MARLLGQCLARSLMDSGAARPEIVIPVPLHPSRLRARGYNQALEIARPLSNLLKIPMDADTCVRLRAITPQEGLGKEERRTNVRGAFGVTRPLRAKHIAVIDDVVTTGSTTTEIAQALLQAGADRIDIWGVARTLIKVNPQGTDKIFG
jgi:ComF family protein